MRNILPLCVLSMFQFLSLHAASDFPSWGFFGHRLINKMAIFTLPEELFGFYKQNLAYITEHAVDPDKRRYASRFEAVRHYIDLDVWHNDSTAQLPNDFQETLIRHAKYTLVCDRDSIAVQMYIQSDSIYFFPQLKFDCMFAAPFDSFLAYWKQVVAPMYYDDEWAISGADLDDFFLLDCFGKSHVKLLIQDQFSQHGILPYFLQTMQGKITHAFHTKDVKAIIRLSAELGHYLGDAHVPLHTTENYNGQKTGQTGIHAFWETRIPELFADDEYEFHLESATYIRNKAEYFWKIVLHSHSLVEELLRTEKHLSGKLRADKQYCYEARMGRIERMQSPEFARALSDALKGTIEEQMRSAAQALGDCIYTAWVDAGQPVIDGKIEAQISDIETNPKPEQRVGVRPHEND